MSPAVSLLAFFIFSFGVGLSGQLYAAFFAPPMLLFALKISIARAVCTRLAVLNIFAILSALSPAIVGNYELAGVIFLRANLIMAFAILLWMFVVKHKMRPTYKICFCRCGRIGVVELSYRSGLFDFYASFLKSKSSR